MIQVADERCPATTRHVTQHLGDAAGVQCKFTKGHEGDHAGYAGAGFGDIFWPQEAVTGADGTPSDEDRIRDAMAEAADYPGRIVTR